MFRSATAEQLNIIQNTEEILCGKVVDMSEDVACRYWIPKAGVKHNKEIMHITVEHEGEVKAIDFSEQTKR